jgi:hypothetical protein
LLGGGRIVFLNLVVLVGLLDAHLALNTRHAQAEVRVVKHADGQRDGFRAEVDYYFLSEQDVSITDQG